MPSSPVFSSQPPHYDALLVVSFGGPDGPDDVLPFLENVLRGRNVPRERMLEVAEHYSHFGGKSPINDQNRQLIAALADELAAHGPRLPIYWGNRNWHPLLADTLRQMAADGGRRPSSPARSVRIPAADNTARTSPAPSSKSAPPPRRSTSSACSSIILVSSSR